MWESKENGYMSLSKRRNSHVRQRALQVPPSTP